jgi:hypothetical protein
MDEDDRAFGFALGKGFEIVFVAGLSAGILGFSDHSVIARTPLMSFDVYEPACYPVVIWPDSVDGGRHLVSSWRVKDCCTITFWFNLAYCVCRQEPEWKEKGHRSADCSSC